MRVAYRFLRIACALLAAWAFVPACSSTSGGTDGGGSCEDQGLHTCNDGQCHACCADAQCNQGYECKNFTCTKKCKGLGADCSADGKCCTEFVCDMPFTQTCIAPCVDDPGCAAAHADLPFAADLLCTEGLCDWKSCSKDGDCTPGLACANGDCVTPISNCEEFADIPCVVQPGNAVTLKDTTVDLTATAFMGSGALAPGVSFTWKVTSSVDNVVTLSPSEGKSTRITGDKATGKATITATIKGCTQTCTAEVLNYGAVVSGSRVVVVNELTSAPLSGITVRAVTNEKTTERTTDDSGIATFDTVFSIGSPADVTVYSADVTVGSDVYNTVTMAGVQTNDVIAFLGAQPDATKVGGYKGKFDFKKVPCSPDDKCDTSLGITAASIPGSLFNITLNSILGDMLMTHVEIGSALTTDVALPGGLMACIEASCFKPDYRVVGVPPSRVAWALGGRLELADLVTELAPIFTGNLDIGLILSKLIPFLQKLHTGLVTNVPINPIDKIVDTADIDGDTNMTELVADYARFPELPGGDMQLNVPLDKRMAVTVPDLPSYTADKANKFYYDGVLLVAGAVIRGAGLVPLGLGAGVDKDAGGAFDGKIAPIQIAATELAGRVPEEQVQRIVLALALNTADLMSTATPKPPVKIAGQIYRVQNFTDPITLREFLAPPTEFTYNKDTQTKTFTSTFSGVPDGMSFIVLNHSGSVGNWQVMLQASTEGSFTLPATPATDNRTDSAVFFGMKLKTGLDYQDLIAFDGDNIDRLFEITDDFLVVATTGLEIDLGCATSGGSSLALLALFGLMLLYRRRR